MGINDSDLRAAGFNPQTGTYNPNAAAPPGHFQGPPLDSSAPLTVNAQTGAPVPGPVQAPPTYPQQAPPPPGYPQQGPPAPNWMDLTQPGAAESAWDQHGKEFFTPGMGEGYSWGAIPGITAPGMGIDFAASTIPGMSGHMGADNLARDAYFQAQQMRPELGGPGLDPYYDNAKRRASESINQQAAARGSYGSSAALDQNREAFTNLEAEKANREADYNLRRAAEQRGWAGLGGQLGAAAEQSQLGWMQGLGGLAMNAEEMDLAHKLSGVKTAMGAQEAWLNRLLGGFNAGLGVQGAHEGRINDAFNNALGFGGATAPMIDQATMDMIQTELGLSEQQLAALLGIPASQLGSDRFTGQKVTGDIGTLAEGAKTATEIL